jgi:hypothetical protein
MLALVLVVFVSGSSLLLGALNNRQNAALLQQTELRYQMEQAKTALLAYAASSAQFSSHATGPGFFPCPDTDNDGQPQSTCDSDSALLGRLPEYADIAGSRFGFNAEYAGIDRQFWYAVGPRYVYHSTTSTKRTSRSRVSTVSNEAVPYRLFLDGQSGYVAFIIAPGEELDTQDRGTGSNNYTDYLDGLNGASGFNYYTSYSSNPGQFNDRILGITLDEYMVYVGTAVAREMKPVVDAYYTAQGKYPYWSLFSSYFRNQFDDEHLWLRTDTSGTWVGNGERWSSLGVIWSPASSYASTGTLTFNGCTGLSFTFTYGVADGVVRSGSGC